MFTSKSSKDDDNDIIKNFKSKRENIEKRNKNKNKSLDYNNYNCILFTKKSSDKIIFLPQKNNPTMSLSSSFNVAENMSSSLQGIEVTWNLALNFQFSNDIKTLLNHMSFYWQHIDKDLISEENGINIQFDKLNPPQKNLPPYTLQLGSDKTIVLFPTGNVIYNEEHLSETAKKTLIRFKTEPYFQKNNIKIKDPYEEYNNYCKDIKKYEKKYVNKINGIISIFVETAKQEKIKILQKYEESSLEKTYDIDDHGIKIHSGWKIPTRKDYILVHKDPTTHNISVDFSPTLINHLMKLLSPNYNLNFNEDYDIKLFYK